MHVALVKGVWGFIRAHAITLAFLASAVALWPLLAEYELFEAFHEYSRAHEDWELDELAMLIVNLTVALMLSSVFQWQRLKRLTAEKERLHQRAEDNARHDPLTGLMNRRAFTETLDLLEKDTNKAAPCEQIIAMIDLDRFKPVNDLYGHAAGDATLRTVSERLQTEVASVGAVARLGGDEFAIIFDRTVDAGQVERLGRRLLHAMESAVEFESNQIFVSCSIGLVKWDTRSRSCEALRQADKALYTAKCEGRNRFAWYDEELDRQSHKKAEIEADLREAIANCEIEPWFQPIINIETHKLIGFEILSRWKHKKFGQISPCVFIEIAEDSGQIGNLGFSVLRRACMAARTWEKNLTISFNVSPCQFHDPKLVDRIESVLKECDFDAHRLTIEITESSVIHDFRLAREKLDALKALGVAVALDDFGTGYSSLASLRQLPFDRIKIDRSFVTNIAEEPQNQKIVSGIMALANGLQLDVTAEGIESKEDLGYLQALDCSLGQGFLFEKAMPADHINWLLETKWGDGRVEPADVVEQTPNGVRAVG